MKPGKNNSNREEAVLEELKLLGNMMKLHEWTTFDQCEAEKEEEIEEELDSRASQSET